MQSRTSPIVVVGNALRALGQLAAGAAVIFAGVTALGAWGYQLDPVMDAVHDWLIRIVTG
jgi:hypothetical protein